MSTSIWPRLFDFEHVEARRNALFVLLVAAIVSPNIPTVASLPAVRLEQLGLALLLPSLFLFVKRHPEARRVAFVDLAFLALAVAITVSLVFAPLVVSQSDWSLRDPFEMARVAEYWLMYRLAFTVADKGGAVTGIFRVIIAAALVSGAIGILQYLGPGGFNDTFTNIWADSHNLETVVKRSRAVGLVGNPNYFGIFAGLLLVVALSAVLLRTPGSRRGRGLMAAAVLMATSGLVMSQSRTAVFAVLGALFLGLLLVVAKRRSDAAYAAAIGLFVASLVLSIAFVEVLPPEWGTFHGRFQLSAFTEDSSVTIRVSRWKTLFSGFFRETPDRCTRKDLEVTKDHEPVPLANTPASAAAVVRDATRKQDIGALSFAVQRFSCDTNSWPTGDLADALVPRYLSALPTDPGTGQPYRSFVDALDGFLVGADLEDPADPEGPVYAIGTIPNMILNPSFEQPNSPASHFDTARRAEGGAAATLARTGQRVFGKTAINADIDPTASVYQLTVFDFPLDADYTASVWARSNAGIDQTVELYLIGVLFDGRTIDPLASTKQSLPADGRWVPLVLPFKTPSSNRLFVLRTGVRAPDGGGNVRVTIDGMMLNEGPFPASFPYVVDVAPFRLRPGDLPGFSDSPLIGVGPQKERQENTFDNEYALMLNRYGVLGTGAYLALFVGAFLVPWRGFSSARRRDVGPGVTTLSLGMGTYAIAQFAFNVAAGSYYSFQIMGIYWLLVGHLARCVTDIHTGGAPEAEDGEAARQGEAGVRSGARSIAVVGLPFFGARAAQGLREAGFRAVYMRRPGASVRAWAGLVNGVLRSDLVYAVGSSIARNSPVDLIARSRRRILLHWVGTDVQAALAEHAAGRVSGRLVRRATHWADAPWLADELAPLGIAASVHPLPVATAIGEVVPLPAEFRVLAYLPQEPQSSYDVESTLEVFRALPEIRFWVVGGFPADVLPANAEALGYSDDMKAVYRETTVLVRLMHHDGLSHSVIEALSFGRHAIWSYPFPGAIQAGDAARAVAELRSLHERFRGGVLEPNHEGAAAVTEKYRWCTLRNQTRAAIDRLLQ